MNKHKVLLMLLVVLFTVGAFPLVKAMPDPFSTLKVWPYDTPEGSEGPIVTDSPATLIIYNTDASHVLTDVWLMLVINEATYNNLVSISTNTSLTFLPSNFRLISSAASPSYKIALSPPGSETTSALGTWPGLEPDDQYDIGSMRDKMGAVGANLYYAVGDLDSSPGWDDHGTAGLDKVDPEFFTITVNLSNSIENTRVMVLALGYTEDSMHTEQYMLNVKSPYTRSTLVVPELAPILLALAPVSAFGLHKAWRKIRKD